MAGKGKLTPVDASTSNQGYLIEDDDVTANSQDVGGHHQTQQNLPFTIRKIQCDEDAKVKEKKEPKLILFVIGGKEKHFDKRPRLKAFKRQLMAVASKTDTIIYTDSAWREFGLLGSAEGTGLYEVDCRTQDMTINSTSKEQSEIAKNSKSKIVLLLVNEASNMVEAVREAVSVEIPIIIIKGLGGLADCLAPLIEKSSQNQNGCTCGKHGLQVSEVEQIFNKNGPHRSSVFDFTSGEHLYQVILDTLCQATSSEEKLQIARSWLDYKLAMKTVSDDPFFEETEQQKIFLAEMMKKALIDQETNFVNFLLENVFSLQTFLTEDNLTDLYEQVLVKTSRRETSHEAKKDTSMHCVIAMFSSLLDDIFDFANYQNSSSPCCSCSGTQVHEYPEKVDKEKFIGFLCEGSTKKKSLQDPSNKTDPPRCLLFDRENSPEKLFKHSELLLFLWAVLSSKFEMARFLLKVMEDRITAALIACLVLRAMKTYIKNNMTFLDERIQFKKEKKLFEECAIEALKQCNDENNKKTRKLLTRQQCLWQKLTCWEIADLASCASFIAQEPCQVLAETIWKGKIRQAKHKEKDKDKGQCKPKKCFKSSSAKLIKVIYAIFAAFVVFPTAYQEFTKHNRSFTALRKALNQVTDHLPSSWKRPAFKFYFNWFCFMSFLGLYLFVLLERIDVETYQWPELVLCSWFLTFYIEEVRLSVVMALKRTKGKLGHFILQQLGFLNLLNYFLGLCIIVGWVIDRQNAYLHGGLCVNFIGFICRQFSFMSINSQTGPKVYMMRLLIKDILVYSVILIIMCLTYGVVTYSLENNGAVENLSASDVLDISVTGSWILLGNKPDDKTNKTYSDPRIVMRSAGRTVYVMLAPILVMNLLIASFSYTFNLVEEKKQVVRKYLRFQMIYRFYYFCPLPPPFSLLIYILWIARFFCCKKVCCRKDCCKKDCCKKDSDSFRKELKEKELKLLSWARRIWNAVGCQEENYSVDEKVDADIKRKPLPTSEDAKDHLEKSIRVIEKDLQDLRGTNLQILKELQSLKQSHPAVPGEAVYLY